MSEKYIKVTHDRLELREKGLLYSTTKCFILQTIIKIDTVTINDDTDDTDIEFVDETKREVFVRNLSLEQAQSIKNLIDQVILRT